MRPFAALERFFERLFERPTARLFRARLQPIQLQRRVERAMESNRLNTADRVVVPNRFTVRIHPDDYEAFGDLAGPLESELGEAALAFARAHRFSVSDRPRVELWPDRSVSAGDARVDAQFSDVDVEHSARHRGAPHGSQGPSAGTAAAPAVAVSPSGTEGDWTWIPEASVPATSAQPGTMVFEVPHRDLPPVVLREIAPDGTQREIAFEGGPLTIGRASDNDLVLRDGRVSRYHARVQTRRGALVFTDLDSTNGSRVNGVAVDEVVLGEGDRVQVGDTILVIERLPA